MRFPLPVYGALFTANILYAGNYTVAREVMPRYIEPYGFILIRVVAAVIVYWMVSFLIVREKIAPKDFPRLILCGLFGVTVNQLLFFKGLSLTSPISASIMMITTPVLVMIIAAVFLGEKVTASKTAGILLGLAGAVTLILYNQAPAGPGSSHWGKVFILMNATSYSIYLVIAKPLMVKYHPLTLVKWVFTFGVLGVIPAGYGEFSAVEWNSFTPLLWLYVCYVVIGVTVIAYFLNIFALSHVNPSVVGVFIFTQPAMAAAIASLAGRDKLDMGEIAASVLVITGVYLVSRTRKAVLIP